MFALSLTLNVPLRFAGKYRDPFSNRKESLTNGELNCSESECDSTSRRLSFMKMVGLGKLKRESMNDHSSQGPEEQLVQEEAVEEVKPREPLSGKRRAELTPIIIVRRETRRYSQCQDRCRL